eukprot:4134753-Pleurochrysis_carterae.AAC.1
MSRYLYRSRRASSATVYVALVVATAPETEIWYVAAALFVTVTVWVWLSRLSRDIPPTSATSRL